MMQRLAVTAIVSLWALSAWAESHATDEATDPAETVGEEMAAMMEDADLEAAEKLFKRTCRACHGNKAQGVASYPKLNDKEPEVIVEKLRIYRSGEKIGPNSVLMIQNAKKLSDEDIANLSVYIATAFD
ncbi:MAG: c-type cytochrome [Boseongicola sp.]|nr:c-type cytochrome [Boseongicola sp.]